MGEIEDLLASGADKVSVTSIAVENPAFVQAAASRFGDQCIALSSLRMVARHGLFLSVVPKGLDEL